MWKLLIILLVLLLLIPRAQHFVGGGEPTRRTIVLYAVDWCHFCRAMKPTWEKVKSAAPSTIRFVEVDGDKVKTPGVTGYPTIMMVNDGHTSIYKGQATDFEELYNWTMSIRPQSD
jgi:thiol-disulfide isomerase/thioredoxin